jgi:hypothetical protein
MRRTLIRDLAEHVGEQVTNNCSEPASEVEAILQYGAPLESAVTVVDNPAVKLGGVELS